MTAEQFEIRITNENAEERISDAIHTILACWDDWDSIAGQEAQKAQDSDAWFAEMQDQIGSVLLGMVSDIRHPLSDDKNLSDYRKQRDEALERKDGDK